MQPTTLDFSIPSPPGRFDLDRATALASANTAFEADGWTYVVASHGDAFVVEIRDEDGVLVGGLPA
jgi:hypothetical protein